MIAVETILPIASCCPKQYRIRLAQADLDIAIAVGCARRAAAIARDATDRFSPYCSHLSVDLCGAAAEYAAALFTGREWSGRPVEAQVWRFPGVDVAPDIQVRCAHGRDGRLDVRKNEHVGHRYVLVVIEHALDDVRICGWLAEKDARQGKWWNEHGRIPSYMVPQGELRDAAELKLL